jgi:hypothetical protein
LTFIYIIPSPYMLLVAIPLGSWFHCMSSFLDKDKIRVQFLFIYYFLCYWDLNSGPSPWATPPVLFCDVLLR